MIEAVQLRPDNLEKLHNFLVGEKTTYTYSHMNNKLSILTLEGTMTASTNDWIIRGVNGELYPCKPDIFEKTYELVKDEELTND
ncbi:MAG: hypothetical protein IM509_05455 [Microcystis sp. M31BS1]|nr:hypothetical protein [Microcystis sp. M31BS1]